MVSCNGDDILVRHILRIPKITQPEVDATTQKLDSIRIDITNGAYDFGSAVTKFSEDPSSKSTAGQIMGRNGTTFLTIPDLDKDIALLLKNPDHKDGHNSK